MLLFRLHYQQFMVITATAWGSCYYLGSIGNGKTAIPLFLPLFANKLQEHNLNVLRFFRAIVPVCFSFFTNIFDVMLSCCFKKLVIALLKNYFALTHFRL